MKDKDRLEKLQLLNGLTKTVDELRRELFPDLYVKTKTTELDEISKLLSEPDEIMSSTIVKEPTVDKPVLFTPKLAKII